MTYRDVTTLDLARWYRAAHERIDALMRATDDAGAKAPVPTCPGWSVHDVIAHVSGIVDDALSGNTHGAPGEAWTASQVRRGREMTMSALLARWNEQLAEFSAATFGGEAAGPMAFPACADLHSHEHDLRHALARPGARDVPAIVALASATARRCVERVGARDIALRVELDGAPSAGSDDARNVMRASSFEFFRAAFGRRSAAQIAALVDGPDAVTMVDELVIFGPARADLVE